MRVVSLVCELGCLLVISSAAVAMQPSAITLSDDALDAANAGMVSATSSAEAQAAAHGLAMTATDGNTLTLYPTPPARNAWDISGAFASGTAASVTFGSGGQRSVDVATETNGPGTDLYSSTMHLHSSSSLISMEGRATFMMRAPVDPRSILTIK